MRLLLRKRSFHGTLSLSSQAACAHVLACLGAKVLFLFWSRIRKERRKFAAKSWIKWKNNTLQVTNTSKNHNTLTSHCAVSRNRYSECLSPEHVKHPVEFVVHTKWPSLTDHHLITISLKLLKIHAGHVVYMPRCSKTVVKSFLDVSRQLGLAPACILHRSDDHISRLSNDDWIFKEGKLQWKKRLILFNTRERAADDIVVNKSCLVFRLLK